MAQHLSTLTPLYDINIICTNRDWTTWSTPDAKLYQADMLRFKSWTCHEFTAKWPQRHCDQHVDTHTACACAKCIQQMWWCVYSNTGFKIVYAQIYIHIHIYIYKYIIIFIYIYIYIYILFIHTHTHTYIYIYIYYIHICVFLVWLVYCIVDA